MTPSALDPRAPTTLVDRVRARLRTQAGEGTFGPDLRPEDVIGALELTDDAKAAARRPTLAVLCLRDQAGPNRVPDPDQGGVVHRVTTTLGVYAGVPSRNDPGGKKREEDGTWKAGTSLDALVAQARAVLLAWAPDGPFSVLAADRLDDDDSPPPVRGRWAPLELRAGRLVSLRDGVAWWEDRYETHRLVRGAGPADPPGAVPSTVHSGLHDAGASPAHRHTRLTGDVAC